MNVFPLVFSCLWIFAILAASFIRQSGHLQAEKTAYQGLTEANRKSLSLIEEERYHDKKTADTEKKEEEKGPKKKKEKKDIVFQSFREKKNCDNEFSKFNLVPLLTTKSPVLYEAAAELIRILYGKSPFFKNYPEKDWEYKILDTLILAASKQDYVHSLIDLVPKEDLTSPLFYKILRGTKKYHYQTGKGYPPLHHFFTFNNDEKKAICFPKAPMVVLEAYFGQKVTSAIINQEKEKWEKEHRHVHLSSDELENLLNERFSFGTKKKDISQDLSFSHPKKKKKKLYAEDPKTGIYLETPI